MTIRDVFSIATTTVSRVADVVIAGGGVLILAAGWFAGPARAARLAREAIPPRANTSARGSATRTHVVASAEPPGPATPTEAAPHRLPYLLLVASRLG